MTVGRRLMVRILDCNLMTTASLTREEYWRPNIVMRNKTSVNRNQVFLAELVFRPINDRAWKNVSFEATEKSIRGAGRLERNYMGCGLIKAIVNFSESYNNCITWPMKSRVMCRLHFWHNSRHIGVSYFKEGSNKTAMRINPSSHSSHRPNASGTLSGM